jgi:hypothetical protein
LKFRKSTIIFINLWEKVFQKIFNQVINEFTTQLVEYQSKVTQELELGDLQTELLKVLLGCQSQICSGQETNSIEVMTRMEYAFGALRMSKG